MSDWTKSQGEILPLILSFFGLYPREDAVTLQRLIRAAQCVYWIGCGVFLLINSTSSAYIIVKNLITPVSRTPLLDALVEALFTIESNRGIFFCLILAFFCKNGLRQMVQETENLGNFFQMDKSFGRKIRHITLTLVGLISIFQFSEKFFGFYTWLIVYRSKGLEFAPYFELSPRLAIPSFGFFAMIPDFLARVVLTLVFVSGFVLLACLNTISKNFSCNRRFGKLKDLRSSRRQYYVLASLLENLNANLGTLLAISLLADLAPVCGRVARLLFPIPDSTQISQTASIAKNVFLILIGALFYIICLHLPFVLLHKKTLDLQRHILARKRQRLIYALTELAPRSEGDLTNEMDTFLDMLEEEALVLSPVQGFQIRGNFPLVIMTVLSSYTFLLFQTMKNTSEQTESCAIMSNKTNV